MKEAPTSVRRFLAARHVAVAGVSRDSKQAANCILRKLRAAGQDVVAINPRAQLVEGGPCFANLESVPGKLDAVMIATPPAASVDVVRACAALHIPLVWMHRAIGEGSVSEEAVRIARESNIEVIVGGCPMMYAEPVDVAHRCARLILGWTGRLPRDGR